MCASEREGERMCGWVGVRERVSEWEEESVCGCLWVEERVRENFRVIYAWIFYFSGQEAYR